MQDTLDSAQAASCGVSGAVRLTEAQTMRLDALEPEARVIGSTWTGQPIVRRPSGAVSAINPYGRLVPAPGYGRNPTGRTA